jgi:acyl-CoA synthetase (AMP-forming)/AMP-acid ligase II
VGRPLEGVRVEIRDESERALPPGEVGEICVSGRNLMSGYYDLASVTSKRIRGGFFHTGDLGFLDEAGYLHIVDRVTDTIVRHGLTLYPHEIEEVLGTHPEIQEAAVLGVSDGMGNEDPIAVCVPAAWPAREGLEADLLDYAARRLPIFKVPIRVEFRKDLPKTATGKVVKRALRQKWA